MELPGRLKPSLASLGGTEVWEWLTAFSLASTVQHSHFAPPQLSSVENGACFDIASRSSCSRSTCSGGDERGDERDDEIFVVEMGHASGTHADAAGCTSASSRRPVERQTSPKSTDQDSPLSACGTLERSVSESPPTSRRLRDGAPAHVAEKAESTCANVFTRPTIDMRLERDLVQAKANARANQFDPFQRPERPVPQIFMNGRLLPCFTLGSVQATVSSLPPPQHLAPVALRRNQKRLSVCFSEEELYRYDDGASDEERGEDGAPDAGEEAPAEKATSDPAGREKAPRGGGGARGKSCLRKPGAERRASAEIVARSGAGIREGYLARLGVVRRVHDSPTPTAC